MWEEINDRISQVAGNQNTVSRSIEIAATISIVKSAAGYLHTINVGLSSNPTMTLFDNASGASGTVLAHIEPGSRGSYVVDANFTSGLTAYLTAGNSPRATLAYR